MSEINDFGFTFQSDDTGVKKELDATIEQYKAQLLVKEAELQQWQSKFNQLFKLVMSFLLPLKQQPEKPTLVWANRGQVVDDLISKITAIKESK